tara:strand:- start:86 stop:1144 length:1059 start_codon:yes stop_codon:yes gene_type:complete
MSDFKVNSITDRSGTSGPIIAGVSTNASSGCMILPKGPTEHRGGRGRLVFVGGYFPSPHANIGTLDFVDIATLGNATDFGNLSVVRTANQMGSSGTRGILAAGGFPGTASYNAIDYITFQSGGGANEFGDLSLIRANAAGVGDGIRGVLAGGENPASPYNSYGYIEFVTIATTGNGSSFGDLITPADTDSSVADRTRGVICCTNTLEPGNSSPNTTRTNTLEFITTAVGGTAQDFGDLTIDRRCGNGVSSSTTRGLFYSGTPGPTARRNTIDFITIQTKGNASDFGDLTTGGNQDGASHGSNLTRSVNHAPTDANTIEFVTIATLGNTQDFGDATHASDSKGGIDNSNGSIE